MCTVVLILKYLLAYVIQGDGDTVEAHAIITACTPREAKYLLEHLLDMALSLVSVWGCGGVGGRVGGWVGV